MEGDRETENAHKMQIHIQTQLLQRNEAASILRTKQPGFKIKYVDVGMIRPLEPDPIYIYLKVRIHK